MLSCQQKLKCCPEWRFWPSVRDIGVLQLLLLVVGLPVIPHDLPLYKSQLNTMVQVCEPPHTVSRHACDRRHNSCTYIGLGPWVHQPSVMHWAPTQLLYHYCEFYSALGFLSSG